MACFLVPTTEAVVTTVAEKVIKSKEKKSESSSDNSVKTEGIVLSKKIGILNKMLWGGSALLAFEHLWHGEISPAFPFLTAVEEGNTADMLKEMSTVGVSMAITVTAVWAIMMLVLDRMAKKQSDAVTEE